MARLSFLEQTWEAALTLPDQRPIYEWAADIELPGPYAAPGGFDTTRVPFVREVFHALANPSVREVTSMSAVQCLKTLIGEIWWLHTIVENPGPSQWLQTTDDDAKQHAEERFNQLIDACPKVKAYFSENRHEKKICSIVFKHMYIRMQGAENMRNLQRKSIKNQMCSEVWQWPVGRLKEAKARLTQFGHTSKRYIESQPGDEGDDMHKSFLAGDQNTWSLRCVSCAHIQPWEWSVIRADESRAGMRWEDSPRTRRENGEWRWGELAPTIRYECAKCGHGHRDEPRTRHILNANGLYVPMNPDAPITQKSFTWNQLTVENIPWFDQVKEFHEANELAKKGDDTKLRVFFQKHMAQPYDPIRFFKFNRPQIVEINTEWPDEYIRPFTVDVQEDCFWGVIRAWAKSGESRLLWAGKMLTWDEVATKQAEFKVYDGQVFVDCSDQTRTVYHQCANHGHVEIRDGQEVWICWRGLNGDHRRSFPYRYKDKHGNTLKVDLPFSWPERGGDPLSGKNGQGQGLMCPYIHWSNPTIKDITAKLRDGKGAKWQAYPGVPQEWSQHMYAERKMTVWSRHGGESLVWSNPGRRPNHLWDCENMSTVVACIEGIIGDGIPAAEYSTAE